MNKSELNIVDILPDSVVDLSLPLEDGMITYPTRAHTPFAASVLGRHAVEGRETRKVTLGSHCGTHIDAASHFVPNGETVDQIPLDKLVGPAWLVDVGTLAPGTIIETETILSQLPDGLIQRLLIRTDWSSFWNTAQYYINWPTLAPELVEALIDRGVKVLGIDFPSPDPAISPSGVDCPAHQRFLNSGVTLVEYLNNLDKLRPGSIFLIAMPLRLKGFDGSPARVAAFPI